MKKNNRVPVQSDIKRGLIPDYHVYCKRFGTMNNARKLAGIPELINLGYGRSIEFVSNN